MTRVRDLEVSIEQLVKPKGNASEKLAEIKNKVRQTTHELDEARQKLSDLTDRFNRVKKERLQKFTDCLDTIANSIDQIYKVGEKCGKKCLFKCWRTEVCCFRNW